jgi:hypothetical protein
MLVTGVATEALMVTDKNGETVKGQAEAASNAVGLAFLYT